MEFYIIQFNNAEKCQSVLVENLLFKNKTLKVVLWGHRAGFFGCAAQKHRTKGDLHMYSENLPAQRVY